MSIRLRQVFTIASLFAFVVSMHGQARGQAMTVVEHIDIIPSSYQAGSEENAARLLRAQVAASQRDTGVISYVVYQQNDGPNHYTVVETWRDKTAYEAHEGAPHTVKFRKDIQSLLGSPFDSREHHQFQ